MTFETLTELPPVTSGDCGSGACGCASAAAPSACERTAAAMPVQKPETRDPLAGAVTPAINGIALLAPGEQIYAQDLRERAYAELLRQEAVRLGLLSNPFLWQVGLMAPVLQAQAQEVIDRMLESEVTCPQPSPEESQRYYDAHQAQFTVGQARRVRHILFAVTPGVNVQALAQRAEKALLELKSAAASPERFAELAGELSNCPTGAQSGDLGWLKPEDCAPEFAKEIFFKQESSHSKGLRPRLVHTRFGFHIVDVLDINPGHIPAFAQLTAQIASRLQWQSRATALRQYMRHLVGLAQVQGIELDGDASPLVQ